MAGDLKLRNLLADLADSGCEFVVIGSSALAIQGWDVAPTDLDLLVPTADLDVLREHLGVDVSHASWVEDGDARRLECATDRGSVDLYIQVSGGFSYEEVARDAKAVAVESGKASVKVGSLAHVRDMRAAVGRTALPPDSVPPTARTGALRIIAIDGPAGAGKSTVTRAVAKRIGFTYLDTGAMYRSVALAVLEQRADTDDHREIARIAEGAEIRFRGEKVFLGERDVTRQIRTPDVTRATPHIAAYPEVRDAMVKQQRRLFTEGGFVAEGRDTGTVVAPDAPLKIYLTASPEERARRRALETGESAEAVLTAIRERDRMDSSRRLSALRIAEDAVVVDTTDSSIEEVVDEIVDLARERGIC